MSNKHTPIATPRVLIFPTEEKEGKEKGLELMIFYSKYRFFHVFYDSRSFRTASLEPNATKRND